MVTTEQIRKQRDVVTEPHSSMKKEAGLGGRVNKTLDFDIGNHCLFPIVFQKSTLVSLFSFNHDYHGALLTMQLFQHKPLPFTNGGFFLLSQT